MWFLASSRNAKLNGEKAHQEQLLKRSRSFFGAHVAGNIGKSEGQDGLETVEGDFDVAGKRRFDGAANFGIEFQVPGFRVCEANAGLVGLLFTRLVSFL